MCSHERGNLALIALNSDYDLLFTSMALSSLMRPPNSTIRVNQAISHSRIDTTTVRSMPRPFFAHGYLQRLPVELLCLILGHLEMRDLLACTLVSKGIRKAALESSRIQYTIELARHRMVSLLSPSASPAFATRLKLLRDRERAWKYMDWKKRHTLKLPPTGSVYEFVGGLYGNGREDDSRATASISFLELPSTDGMFFGEPPRELQMWTHAMGDVTIIDFTMDPSQDLLVLVALAPPDSKSVYELHLRSLKTNRPHPKAPVSVLPCLSQPTSQPQPSDVVAAVRVQVSGNLVALLIKEVLDNSGAHLEIWNWEHGAQYSSSMSRPSGIDDFTFLTRESFLLVRPTGRFEVYSFVEPLHRPTIPVLRASYAFPPLSDGFLYWYISMSSNPAPGYVPRSFNGAQDDPTEVGKQIYYPRPDERIHACCLYIFNPTVDENPVVHSFVFFINLKTLLNPPPEWFPKGQQPPHTKPPKNPSTRQSNRSESDPYSSDSSTPSSAPPSMDFHLFGLASSSTYMNSIATSAAYTYPPFPTFDSHFPSPPTANGHSTSHDLQPQPTLYSALSASTSTVAFVSESTSTSTTPSTSTSNRRSDNTARSSPSSPVQPIPWEVWGPKNTRWFEECLSTDWQHAIYGLRTVESVRLRLGPDGGLSPTTAPHTPMFLFHPQAVGVANTNVPGVVQVNVVNANGQQPTAVNGVQVQVQVQTNGASSVSANPPPAQNGPSSSTTTNSNLQPMGQQAQPQPTATGTSTSATSTSER
ncbi:unnamed protein product [Cyclocybe aegerita]|uniref:F-box domain-containing protein n=1 Tax=Cyclocybe aegerita TaxID=1973307 RepID=A0A8S0XY42_CYCAE|nr:unnamed protein product [Cyclocybe aegerita]